MGSHVVKVGAASICRNKGGWLTEVQSLAAPSPKLAIVRQQIEVSEIGSCAILSASDEARAPTTPESVRQSSGISLTYDVHEDPVTPLPQITFALHNACRSPRRLELKWMATCRAPGLLLLGESDNSAPSRRTYNLYLASDGLVRDGLSLEQGIELVVPGNGIASASITIHFHTSFTAPNGFSGQCIFAPVEAHECLQLALTQRMSLWPLKPCLRPLHKYFTPILLMEPDDGSKTATDAAACVRELPNLRRLFLPHALTDDPAGSSLRDLPGVQLVAYDPQCPTTLREAFSCHGLPALSSDLADVILTGTDLSTAQLACARYLGKAVLDTEPSRGLIDPSIREFVRSYVADVKELQESLADVDNARPRGEELLGRIADVKDRLLPEHRRSVEVLEWAPPNLVLMCSSEKNAYDRATAIALGSATNGVVAQVPLAGETSRLGLEALILLDDMRQHPWHVPPVNDAEERWSAYREVLQSVDRMLRAYLTDGIVRLVEEVTTPENILLVGTNSSEMPLEFLGERLGDQATYWGERFCISRIPFLPRNDQMLYLAKVLAGRRAASELPKPRVLLVLTGTSAVPGVEPLQLSALERESLETMLRDGGWDYTTLDSREGTATVARLRECAVNADIVYISSHARMGVQEGELVLQDRILSATEIANSFHLKQNAVVMLNSCQSAAVRHAVRGNLPLAFLNAGARHCIGTLWSLSEIDGAILATFLMPSLCSASAVKALRTAKHNAGLHRGVSDLSNLGFVHYGDPTDERSFAREGTVMPSAERCVTGSSHLAQQSLGRQEMGSIEGFLELELLFDELTTGASDPRRRAYRTAQKWEARALECRTGDPSGASEAHRRAFRCFREARLIEPDYGPFLRLARLKHLGIALEYHGLARMYQEDGARAMMSFRRATGVFERLVLERRRLGFDTSFAVWSASRNRAFLAAAEGEETLRRAVGIFRKGDLCSAAEEYQKAAECHAKALHLFPVPAVSDTINMSGLEDLILHRRKVAGAYQQYQGSAVAAYQKAGRNDEAERAMRRLRDFASQFQNAAMKGIERLQEGVKLLNTEKWSDSVDCLKEAAELLREAAVRSPTEEAVFKIMLAKYLEAYGWYHLAMAKEALSEGSDAHAQLLFSSSGFLFRSAAIHATGEKQYLMAHERNCDAYAAIARANLMVIQRDNQEVVEALGTAAKLWEEAHSLLAFPGFQVRSSGIRREMENVKRSGARARFVVT